MKKILVCLSILSVLGLSACATKTVEKEDCCSNLVKVNIPDLPNIYTRVTSVDVRDKPEDIQVDPSMTINAQILFEFNKANLTNEGKKMIANISDLASRNMKKSINLIGSTDFLGTDKYNSKLAEKRAIVVRNEFIKDDVPANKIDIKIYLSQVEQSVIDNCKQPIKECVANDRNTSIFVSLDM